MDDQTMIAHFSGKTLPDDLYHLFADLQMHKCVKCQELLGMSLGLDGEIKERSGTLVDKDARPVGLVCISCFDQYTAFTYKEFKDDNK